MLNKVIYFVKITLKIILNQQLQKKYVIWVKFIGSIIIFKFEKQ